MSRDILHDATDQSVIVRIVDATDGTPETGVTSATSGLSIEYQRGTDGALVAISPSDLSDIEDAHSDGGILHIRDGYYRIDVPDAAFASGAEQVQVYVSATGMIGVAAMHVLYTPDKTGYALSATGLDAITVFSTYTIPTSLAKMFGALCGKVSGAGTGTVTIYAGGSSSTAVIVASTDAAGNRTAVNLSP